MKVVQEGWFSPLLEENRQIFAYQRDLESEHLICLNNFYEAETEAILQLEGYDILPGSYLDAEVENTIRLRPYEPLILCWKD